MALIPFGIYVTTGEVIDIESAKRGRSCDCECPSCGTPLIARKGERIEKHFAHDPKFKHDKTRKECEYSFHVSVRMMARQIFEERENIEIDLPDDVISKGSKVRLNNLQAKEIIEGIDFDLIGKKKEYTIVIFLSYKGRPAPEYKDGMHIGALEINIQRLPRNKEFSMKYFSERKAKGISYKESLVYLLQSDFSRRWIYHPRSKLLENSQ